MSKETLGQSNKVTVVGGTNPVTGDSSYDINPDDDVISISGLTGANAWLGGTITLPGPATQGAGNGPNNGDHYEIADPTNALTTTGHTVTINGGGYKFLGAAGTGMVTQAVISGLTVALTTFGQPQRTCINFTFDALQQIWIVC